MATVTTLYFHQAEHPATTKGTTRQRKEVHFVRVGVVHQQVVGGVLLDATAVVVGNAVSATLPDGGLQQDQLFINARTLLYLGQMQSGVLAVSSSIMRVF